MARLSQQQIPAAFQNARAAQSSGQFDRALALYANILEVKPDLAEVHFNIAQILARRADAAGALEALKRAAKAKPKEAAIWSAMVDVAVGAKNPSLVRDVAGRVSKADLPTSFKTELSGRMGVQRLSPEEKTLKAAIKKGKSSAAAHAQYGSFLLNAGRAAEAIPLLQIAVKLGPQSAMSRLALGYAFLRSHDLERARSAFRKAADLGLNSAQLYLGQGHVALAQKDDAAADFFAKALAAGATGAEVHALLANALQAARRDDEAYAAFETALSLDPKNTKLMSEKATLLQNMGRVDEARALLKTALDHEPENASLFLAYASAGKLDPDDVVMARAEALQKSGRDNHLLAFAVSKLAEAKKENPFPLWRKANALARTAFPYGIEADIEAAHAVRTAWNDRNEGAWEKASDAEPAPIFVTGMPRSGTTLIEQIIAAHSAVASGGEVGILGRYLQDLSRPPDTAVIRDRYWSLLQNRFPGVRHVTDKSIATYVKIGFIKSLFPNAKIVVVRRDARDNALSIFKNVFADGTHRYSNDLRDIARFIRLFEAQVAFWKDAAPGTFTTIRYEDVIADPERQSRQLIADVGLDWEDACLSFYNSKTRVDTLSNLQVRQPIYASSVGAWRKYESELAPFLEAYDGADG